VGGGSRWILKERPIPKFCGDLVTGSHLKQTGKSFAV
jgi:hypothetical protein